MTFKASRAPREVQGWVQGLGNPHCTFARLVPQHNPQSCQLHPASLQLSGWEKKPNLGTILNKQEYFPLFSLHTL